MGHIRLGKLPRTRKWIQVLDLIDDGFGAPAVAASTMDASQGGLKDAGKDPGLIYSVWLLTQIPLAARKDDFSKELRRLGIDVSKNPDIFEITGGFTAAIDLHLKFNQGRTDLGEMAQMAAVETLTTVGMPASDSLFGTPSENVQASLKSFSTQTQFSSLAREFFTRLTKKYLTYFLSRELSNFVEGGGKGRFANIEEHSKFNKALDLHCREATRIIQEFSGGWFSKTNYEGGITPEKTAGFVSYALTKLRDEFSHRGRAIE